MPQESSQIARLNVSMISKEYIPAIVPDKTVYQSESDSYRAQYSSFDHLTPFNR